MVGNSPGAIASGQYENVACPFCGILCDDLSVKRDGTNLSITRNGCAKAKAGFERLLPDQGPQIAGQPASLDAAIAEAARLLKASNLPVFSGLGTDVAGMRAVMKTAEAAGGVVDHAHSESSYKNYKVLQTGGWILTTLTEARNRADLFIFVGSDIHASYPRFFERVVNNDKVMFADVPPKRTIVFLGEGLDTAAAHGAHIGDVISLPAKPERIGEILVALRALAKGVAIQSDSIGGLPRADVEDLLARCKSANYGVMVWSATSLKVDDADLTVQAINEFIKDFNQTSRFAGLSMGGTEGSMTTAAVSTWQSGFAFRVSFASGAPDYDVERYQMTRMVAAKETDLLVWLASFAPDLSPPDTDIPMIVLGTPGLALSHTPAVFIPVGTPGLDHEGQAIRCDSSVSLPLQNLQRSDLPRTEDVLANIEAAL